MLGKIKRVYFRLLRTYLNTKLKINHMHKNCLMVLVGQETEIHMKLSFMPLLFLHCCYDLVATPN